MVILSTSIIIDSLPSGITASHSTSNISLTDAELDTINTSLTAKLYLGDRNDINNINTIIIISSIKYHKHHHYQKYHN